MAMAQYTHNFLETDNPSEEKLKKFMPKSVYVSRLKEANK